MSSCVGKVSTDLNNVKAAWVYLGFADLLRGVKDNEIPFGDLYSLRMICGDPYYSSMVLPYASSTPSPYSYQPSPTQYYPTSTGYFSYRPTTTPSLTPCESLLSSTQESFVNNCMISNFSNIPAQFYQDVIMYNRTFNASAYMDQLEPYFNVICGSTNCTNYVKNTLPNIISTVGCYSDSLIRSVRVTLNISK
jgi:hypothetical protein